MDNELEMLKKRLVELSRRSAERGKKTNSEFLSLGEQTELLRLRLESPCALDGGYALSLIHIYRRRAREPDERGYGQKHL